MTVPPRHLAFVAAAAPGHVNPTLPLIEELVRRGHRVSYATSDRLAPVVGQAGATPVLLPSGPPAGPPASGPLNPEMLAGMLAGFTAAARVDLPVLLEHFRADRPDAVCCDMMTFGGRVLARRLGVPDVGLVPNFAENERFSAQRVFMPADWDHRHPALVRAQQAMAALLDEYRVGADVLAMSGAVPRLSVVFIPREFQLAADTFDDRFVFVGPSLGSAAGAVRWQPAGRAPVVLVSLGTVCNDRPEFFRTCIEAFADGGWQLVLAVGERVDIGALGPVPPHVQVHRQVPQPAVLRRARVFVTHGGMNSVMESLLSGVPMVVVPQMPEQECNARRVAELGLGRVLPAGAVTAASLRAAVESVRDGATVAAVARMREVIAGSGGAVRAAAAIESLLATLPAS